MRCPALSRDEMKEGFVNATGEVGEPGDAVQAHVSNTFFDAIQLLLGRRITVVVEAAFQHRVWAPRLEPLLAIADVRIVLCEITPELAHARQVERGLADPARTRFHHDHAARIAQEGKDWRALPISPYEPPSLNVPTLSVDTTDGYQPAFETILAFARGRGAATVE